MPDTKSLQLPPSAFDKIDKRVDALFYAAPRFVLHIDDRAVQAVTDLYRRLFPPQGKLLDLMSSWVSHLPEEVSYREVIGHGMNKEELTANPRLTYWFTQDLNTNPVLPLGSSEFDGAAICVSVQYLQRPVEVLAEVARVLRPGAPFVITFSNRCFPTKAVAVWTHVSPNEQAHLVELYLKSAGYADVAVAEILRAPGDPLWAVVAQAPAERPRLVEA